MSGAVTAMVTVLVFSACSTGQPKPYTFLSLTEQQDRKIGDDYPQSAVGDVVAITKVQLAKHEEYLKLKKDGTITAEDRHAGYVYYATKVSLCVPFSNGAQAIVDQSQRYKAPLPSKE